MRTLLKRVAEIAKPGSGCPKVLMAVARLVGQDWLEGGELRVELTGDDEKTTLTIMCEYGVGIRERLLPPTELRVPFDEFARALELSPSLVLPLRISDDVGKITLTPLLTPEKRAEEAVAVRIDERSLGETERKTAPPKQGAEPEAVFAAAPDSDTTPTRLARLALDELDDPAPVTARPHAIAEAGAGEEANLDELEEIGPGDLPEEGAEGAPSWSANVHTRPTVRRMVAVDVSAIRKRDPRSEED
ncbi:MAG: hypothetical protein KF819_25155 [Labilithrix sp.]|nr:hypothetical protein [Labilithrix sp.]